MAESFTNNASTTLAGAGLGAAAPGVTQTWEVLSIAGFPTSGQFRAVCAGELIVVTGLNPAVSPPTMTGRRGQEGTAAGAKPAGTTFTEVLTADALATLMTETLARVGVAAPLTVSYPGGDPRLALPAATGSADGYMTAAQATKLAAIAASAQVNVLEGVTVTAPLTTGPIAGKQQPLAINPASGAAPGTLSAAHYTDLANAQQAAAGNTLVKRNASGDANFRYAYAAYFNYSGDENRGDQPARLIGGAGDAFMRTWNPYAVTVGAALGLNRGYADGQKLDRMNESWATDGNGWRVAYTPNGRRIYSRQIEFSMPAAAVAVCVSPIVAPAGQNFGTVTMVWSVVSGDGQSINFGIRYGSAGPGHGQASAGPTTAQLVGRTLDGTTMNTYSAVGTLSLLAYDSN